MNESTNGLSQLLSEELAEDAKAAAARRGCSTESFVRQCVRKGLNGAGGDHVPKDPKGDPTSTPEAKASASLFRTVAEHSPVGIYCFRAANDAFLYANPRLSEMVGYSRAKLQSEISPLMLIHPEERSDVHEEIRRRLEGEVRRTQFDTRIVTSGGETRHACAFGSRVDYRGQPTIVGTMLDITERVRRQEELKEAKEEAERMNQLKSSFLANMSHEIRTPITSILGYTELLAAGEAQPTGEVTDVIHASGERLLETVDNVLYLAQLDSGSLQLRPDRVDLSQEVARITRRFGEKAQGKGLFFNVEAVMDTPEVYQDAEVISRLLSALIDNAVKFTKTGGVTVRARGGASTVTLEVQDTGIGMNPDNEEIFEAFQQESTGLQRTYEGSGLGLTIAKKLTELAGGTIDIDSDKEQGTVATVCLPRRAGASTETEGSLHSAHVWGLEELPPDQSVLVVEDDPATRELIPQLLPETYTVATAMNVATALEKAQEKTYDVVFMDINLKDQIDGVALKERMEEINGYEMAIFVAVTAYAMPGDGERFHAEGFDGYVPKPFTRERFYENLLQIW